MSLVSGFLVGFSLGLIGGGGSILAIPLLRYLVGYPDVHTVIGTTALSVGLNAFINSITHSRRGGVDYRIGLFFGTLGVLGVLVGTELSLITPGEEILFLFALLMIVVAVYMLREKRSASLVVQYRRPRYYVGLALAAIGTGGLSGFFGIGGGFMIVPSLVYIGGLDIKRAVGTSLVSVGVFGVSTALRYWAAGHIDVYISLLYLLGGVSGGLLGSIVSLKTPRDLLRKIFAVTMILVAIYMIYRNIEFFIRA